MPASMSSILDQSAKLTKGQSVIVQRCLDLITLLLPQCSLFSDRTVHVGPAKQLELSIVTE